MGTKWDPDEVARLLEAWADGDLAAGDVLLPVIYDELHRLSRDRIRTPGDAGALQPAELVREAFERVATGRAAGDRHRTHFRALAAPMVRRVLVDLAGRRPRGPGESGHLDSPASQGGGAGGSDGADNEVVRLHEALRALAVEHPRTAQLVEMHYFAGLGRDEVAEVMQVPPSELEADWARAGEWLAPWLRKRSDRSVQSA
jgi:RNA polymerase sigma-70 factor, ECF subfamily